MQVCVHAGWLFHYIWVAPEFILGPAFQRQIVVKCAAELLGIEHLREGLADIAALFKVNVEVLLAVLAAVGVVSMNQGLALGLARGLRRIKRSLTQLVTGEGAQIVGAGVLGSLMSRARDSYSSEARIAPAIKVTLSIHAGRLICKGLHLVPFLWAVIAEAISRCSFKLSKLSRCFLFRCCPGCCACLPRFPPEALHCEVRRLLKLYNFVDFII